MTVKDAHARLVKANQALAAAQAEVEHADNTLDHALAQAGWTRFRGGFDAKLYVRLGGSPVGLDDVLRHELKGVAA